MRLHAQRAPVIAIEPAEAAATDAEVLAAFAGLAQLSERDQELIRLAAFEELTYAEIAVATNSSASAVKSRLFRARGRLKEAIERRDRDTSPNPDTIGDDTSTGPADPCTEY